MPVVRGAITPAGALVRIQVSVSRSQMLDLRRAGSPIPQPVELEALIDTGSDSTCVDPTAIAPLGLRVHKYTMTNVPAAGGFSFAVEREAGLRIIHPSGDPSRNFIEAALPVVELPLGQHGYQALLGRDLLDRCRFRYDGPARTFALAY
jgi:Retroviral aspartyl protease